MPTDEHGVRQVCLSAFRELGFPGPLRGRTPSIWQTAGPSLFPTPSSPDCADHPPRGTIPPAGAPRPPPPPPRGAPPPLPPPRLPHQCYAFTNCFTPRSAIGTKSRTSSPL